MGYLADSIVEVYRPAQQKRIARLTLAVVVVGHLFPLWLWLHLSPNVRLRADPFVHRRHTIGYLPSQAQQVIEVQLLPQMSHQRIASLKVLDGTRLVWQQTYKMSKDANFGRRNDRFAGPPAAVQRKANAIEARESVDQPSSPVETTRSDAVPVAPDATAATAQPPALHSLFDSAMAIGRQPRQRSLAEVANQQINPDGPRDKLKQGIEDAALPVCLASNGSIGILSPIAIAYAALRGKCKLP